MSELKAIKAYLPTFDADHNEMLLVSHTKENYVPAKQIECYLKSEADKVIAEKDAKILALDAEVFKQKHRAKLFFDERNYAETKLRHHARKRCLAMADALTWEHNYLVDFVSDDFPNVRFRRRHRIKWVNRWLALAEEPTWTKFLQLMHKEAK